jgi:hypothetical protein
MVSCDVLQVKRESGIRSLCLGRWHHFTIQQGRSPPHDQSGGNGNHISKLPTLPERGGDESVSSWDQVFGHFKDSVDLVEETNADNGSKISVDITVTALASDTKYGGDVYCVFVSL